MHKKNLIAVVGIDGIFPGAHDIETFWHNIVNGIDQSAPVPDHRWIAPVPDRFKNRLTPDHTYSRHACLIRDFSFVPEQFSLGKALLQNLDPLYHLTLTAGKRAFEKCVTTAVDPNRIDVVLAAIALPTDSASAFSRKTLGRAIEKKLFGQFTNRHTSVSLTEALSSRVDGLPAALLAWELGVGGNCFTLDAACASSMYAVKLSCDALLSNRADMVVTGGVSRPECLYTQTGFSQLQALSPSGRCSPFDRNADGLVVGEGIGILVLKRLPDAINHGDTIHGVIHGIGLSNDMGGNLLAPESSGQVRAMVQAYKMAGWRPSDVDLIECHGTGTKAGDTTEIISLMRLWENETASGSHCAIGSVKSMIGHLLTAAGAAGMIKTLLAMRHQTLPPTLHFQAPPANSPLQNSPFTVQVRPTTWQQRSAESPRRAAVSAFGFGGINAHLLFEQWIDKKPRQPEEALALDSISVENLTDKAADLPVAIVGMDTCLGKLSGLKAFEHALCKGVSAISKRPVHRWKQADETIVDLLDGFDPKGAFMEEISLTMGEFQIPPNEFSDILPQQLLALKTGAGAMRDAGFALREHRERMGAIIGIEFDFEATNFHLRWQLAGTVGQWNKKHGLDLNPVSVNQWLEHLRDECSPPLTAPRVMGALGGIVASRVAREFRLGGPSFVVSGSTTSGLQALQIAIDQLHQNRVDAMLVGAVDLAGESRAVVRLHRTLGLSASQQIRPFDRSADGTLPGDGAVALVLKRLDRAASDGDRIYAVIHGMGAASGGGPLPSSAADSTYRRSLSKCLAPHDGRKENISLVFTNGLGTPKMDRMELFGLDAHFSEKLTVDPESAIALGATTPICGYTGAAQGLVTLVAAAICLHRRILPPLAGFSQSNHPSLQSDRYHVPRRQQPWYRDRASGPRAALCASAAPDGTCCHVLLEEPPFEKIRPHRISTPGYDEGAGLFVVTGNENSVLSEGLGQLEKALTRSHGTSPIETIASEWMKRFPPQPSEGLAVALVLQQKDGFQEAIQKAKRAIESGGGDDGDRQVFHARDPLGAVTRIAMVYPGSGNHYLGMGRELALRFPSVIDRMDRHTARLKSQFRPWHLMPWRTSWGSGWQSEALTKLTSDPLNMIFGQVVFGGLMTHLFDLFEIRANAIIGYSLGESAALFSHGIWRDRGEMLERMQHTDLFTSQLAGPCQALRTAWKLPTDESVQWRVVVVNRPEETVRKTLAQIPHARLLIVNTPDECVIGGRAPHVEQAISALRCQAVYLDGVVTVHCDAAEPVAEAYRQLHLFPTVLQPDLAVYSCSWAKSYPITSDNIADSIQQQAVDGFHFPNTIQRAADDGIRLFIEAGPRSSCTRMIDRILMNRPHLAVAANQGNDNELVSFLRFLARLASERVSMNLLPLYSDLEDSVRIHSHQEPHTTKVTIGGQPIRPRLPEKKDRNHLKAAKTPARPKKEGMTGNTPSQPLDAGVLKGPKSSRPPLATKWQAIIEQGKRQTELTGLSHQRFLELSGELSRAFADTFELQAQLLQKGARPSDNQRAHSSPPSKISQPSVAFDREKCMAFAIGSVGRVLGPAFDVIDTYRVRVRLPDEPLMLVDRILSVEGEMLSMESGKVVTEHDVLPDAWYLDGNRAPVCISVEAGQADLFLCSYLGIDHQVKGERAYRLLDAVVTFHRGLPRPGETVRYEICIDRFVRQGNTWMFFFRFEGYIANEHLITMRDGCAGFFTEAEVAGSGGILLTERERETARGQKPADWTSLVPMQRESFSDEQVDLLRKGDVAGCFGSDFRGKSLADSLRLPDGRMRLIHRILELDPEGGRYGIGMIRAEADIRPDDWFLTCHFVDDMVMPGTLMYECCAHTLRVYLQRMGWVTNKPGVCYEPLVGNGARLRCRGPVTPATQHVHYEIHIREIGYNPEPFAIADARMFADERFIVFFKDMSLKMTGIRRSEIEAEWKRTHQKPAAGDKPNKCLPLYDRESILAFAIGAPSKAFGEPYRVFDNERKIARLPGPPYCFMDRVLQVEPQPWVLKPGGWVTAQYDVRPEDWYFSSDQSGFMPFCVLLEIALQPCGWLAAYAGSALRSHQDLKFRNLGGSGTLHRQVTPQTGTLTMRCRMTKVNEAADMIIEYFDFEVLSEEECIYTGETYFGFFSADALNQQRGLGDKDPMVATMADWSGCTEGFEALPESAPRNPEEGKGVFLPVDRLLLPSTALLMIDRIDAHTLSEASEGLGYVRGNKRVDPDEWFFKAHFYQDPVCPGSLGIESFLQLLKYAALKRWPQATSDHRFCMLEGDKHNWTYRGQIVPQNDKVTVEARIAATHTDPFPQLKADGLLSVDGLPIYKMENFTLALVPAATVAP